MTHLKTVNVAPNPGLQWLFYVAYDVEEFREPPQPFEENVRQHSKRILLRSYLPVSHLTHNLVPTHNDHVNVTVPGAARRAIGRQRGRYWRSDRDIYSYRVSQTAIYASGASLYTCLNE